MIWNNWSLANIAGIRLDDYGHLNGTTLDASTKAEIARTTRSAAYEIIRRKGATYYAIATGLVRIIEAIIRNKNSVLTGSSVVHRRYGLSNVCYSLPSIVNRDGVAQVLELPLLPEERQVLEKSAQIIRAAVESLGYPRSAQDKTSTWHPIQNVI